MRKYICLLLFFLVLFLGGCGRNDKMKDGFYTAEMSDYSHGWKEYLCIMVKDGIIVKRGIMLICRIWYLYQEHIPMSIQEIMLLN